MILREIIDKIETFAPPEMASEGDNIGLMFGSKNHEVKKVLLALDADLGVIDEAAKLGAQLIVTHHPLMFDPVRQINDDTYEGRCILRMAEAGIALYSAHTNLDSAAGGINDRLADILGIRQTAPMEVTYTDKTGKTYGIGRRGILEKETTLGEFANLVREKFALSSVSIVGDEAAKLKTACVCSGSGASLIPEAVGTDVYVTGDVKYSNARFASQADVNIVVLGHYEAEIVCMQIFKEILNDLPVEIYFSSANTNVFRQV